MADFEAPSFSLGLDFDPDPHPSIALRNDPELGEEARQSSDGPTFCLIEDDEDFETPAVGPDPQASEPYRSLKRLRRGPASACESAVQKRGAVGLGCNVDDEIEEFSSQEDRSGANERSSIRYHSGRGSSKIPLHGNGVLATQSTSQRKITKRQHNSDTLDSACREKSSSKSMFPKLTVSPLRRFQLLDDSDSDSDDPSVSEGINREANKLDSSLKEKQSNRIQYPTTSGQKNTKESAGTSQRQDLWKDFCAEKNFHIPTPALDEICNEYFGSLKDKSEASTQMCDKVINDKEGRYQNSNFGNNDEQNCELGGPTPPAQHYFFHGDPRIRKLVRSRLPYFYPLGAVNDSGIRQPVSSVIDYMSQFNHGESSKPRAAEKNKAGTSSTRGRGNSKKLNAEKESQGSGSWVNPKSSVCTPKDAGKRRVHAVGQSVGHWYTNPDGKRVYVTKDGRELTGQIAYRHYKKESGAGFKKSKKRTAGKRQSAAKKPVTKKK